MSDSPLLSPSKRRQRVLAPASTSSAPGGGRWSLRIRAFVDQFRQSLFFLPAFFVGGSIGLAFLLIELDRNDVASSMPGASVASADSARSILSVIAGGTISAASVVFSLSLIAVQLASSQFSPRVVRDFLRDRVQQVVMGIVVGTFTFSLVILQAVEAEDITTFRPQLTILVAVLFAITSLLAVLVSIDHTAKSLQVGTMIDRVTNETITIIQERFPDDIGSNDPGRQADDPALQPPDSAVVVRNRRAGWITQISFESLADAVEPGTIIRLETAVGTYLTPHARMATVWPTTDKHDDDDEDGIAEAINQAVIIQPSRTMQQDISFGLLKLSDIAMRALSPGINDPNTAVEVVVRLGVIFEQLIVRFHPSEVFEERDRTIVQGVYWQTARYIDSALEPIRRHGRAEPMVQVAIVSTCTMVADSVRAQRPSADLSPLDRQVDLVAADLAAIPNHRDQMPTAQAIETYRNTRTRLDAAGR